MLAVSLEGEHRGSRAAPVATPTPGRGPVLRVAPGVRPVQLQHRVAACPPFPPPRTHLEAMVMEPPDPLPAAVLLVVLVLFALAVLVVRVS